MRRQLLGVVEMIDRRLGEAPRPVEPAAAQRPQAGVAALAAWLALLALVGWFWAGVGRGLWALLGGAP